jgi:hypothetical protein
MWEENMTSVIVQNPLQHSLGGFLDVFIEPSGDFAQDHRQISFVRNGLRKISCYRRELAEEGFFPSVAIVPFPEKPGCSVMLVCPFYLGVERFFYEMGSRWLFPGRQLPIHSFSYCTFFLSQEKSQKFALCEMQFFCQDGQELEKFLHHFPQMEAELKLGASSLYQGNCILESRGQCSSNKNSLIQERIRLLVQEKPQYFDYDVFAQMQHFFITSKEYFQQMRTASHLSRIICVFYLFRKSLRRSLERGEEERYISLKVSQATIHSPFGVKRVVGIFVGLTMTKTHELFGERHLMQAIREYVPEAKLVEGSQFVYHQEEEKVHILYLEIEKQVEQEDFAEEIRSLRRFLPRALEGQIEKMMPNVFMPRNEEEVMKNIVLLSGQLRYVKDIPQILISFEGQTEQDLVFTVILLRILSEKINPPVRELFSEISSDITFAEDRVKIVGFIRGKYKKEATVFRLKVAKLPFIRRDHSVDLLHARQEVVRQLQRVVGEFRDYNGGMIAKHIENLRAFKEFFPEENEEVLESFFHEISPAEIRGVIDPSLLKILYEFWKEASPRARVALENGSVVYFSPFVHSLEELIKSLGLSSSQMLFFSSQKEGVSYFGFILLGLSQEKAEMFLHSMGCD